MERVQKFVQGAFNFLVALILVFLVYYCTRFIAMGSIDYVPFDYRDVAIGLIGILLVVVSSLVRVKLQEKLGNALSIGFTAGFMAAGFELSKKSLWFKDNMEKPILLLCLLICATLLCISLYHKFFKKNK